MGYSQNMQQQQMVLDKAYMQQTSPREVSTKEKEVVQEIKTTEMTLQVKEPDIFDQGYVLMRTFIPGWLMFLIIIAGILNVFKKPISAYMQNILGFTLDDLKQTVKRRKERDKELEEQIGK